MHLLPALLPLLAAAPAVTAYGAVGHQTVALLASRFFTTKTALAVKSLLGAHQTLLSAATWPDYYAHTPAGRYSAAWHYIDAQDNPPQSCGIQYSRDCEPGPGCIVSALVNMTHRVADAGLPWWERHIALSFVVHFAGDIHQPLHTEDLLRGGNQLPVLWNGATTNLHHVWDSSIIEQRLGGGGMPAVARWTDQLHMALLAELQGFDGEGVDVGRNLTRDDRNCLDVATALDCVLEWAQETNRWMCDYVLPKTYPEGLRGEELSGKYYHGAVPIIDQLVAQAGWRLAGWLNAIFDPDGSDAAVWAIGEMEREDEEEAVVVVVGGGEL